MRDRPFPATAKIALQSAQPSRILACLAPIRLGGAVSAVAVLAMLGLFNGDALARARVVVDDSVLESLGPEPTIASLMLRKPGVSPSSARGSSYQQPRAIAQAPTTAPRSRLLLPGASSPQMAPSPQIAAAPQLRLPPMQSAAAMPAVRPAPLEAPRSRLVSAPTLTAPVLRPPAPQYNAPQLALAPAPLAPAPLLPTPPVAPAYAGVRAAPAELPRSQLLLPPVMGERPAPVPAPAPVVAAPPASTNWPSLASSAVAAPLPPTVAFPPPAPAPAAALASPTPPTRQQVAAAAPTARDIQPPAPSTVPAVAPSAAPSASAAKPASIAARLLFQRGTLDPADGSREALSRLAAQLAANPNRRVQIMAYAMGAGNEAENSNEARRLSLDRGLAVRSGLVQQGVRSTQVTVRALGNPGGDGPPDRVDILNLDE